MAHQTSKFRQQILGKPLTTGAVQSPDPRFFPAFLKISKKTWCIGNVWLDGGVATAEFVHGNAIMPLQDIKDDQVVLLKEANHDEDNFTWIWAKQEDATPETCVRYEGKSVVFCTQIKKVGSYKATTQVATFASGQAIVHYEGDDLKNILFLVKDFEGRKANCLCKKCPLWNTPVPRSQQNREWTPISEDKWVVVRESQSVQLAPFVMVDRETRSTPPKYLAAWCKAGEILIGKCWTSRGRLTSCFPILDNLDHNSIMLLRVPNERLSSFSYEWREVDDVRRCQNLVKFGDCAIGSYTFNNTETIVTVNTITGSCVHSNKYDVLRKPSPPKNLLYLIRSPNNCRKQNIKGTTSVYHLEKLLGRGTFGSVFQVRRLTDNTKWAMKIEKKYPGEKVKLTMEANVLKTMNGIPGFSKFLEMSNHQDIVFLVMENLGRSVEDEQPFPFLKALDVATQSLEGLRHLHEVGFIHQDFKPGNMCFGIGRAINKVYIVDFGSTRRYATPKKDLLPPPVVNSFIGTRHFASKAAHEREAQYPKDDLESWIYSLLDMIGGLPWGEDLSRDQMYDMKCFFRNTPTFMLQKLPSQNKFLPIWMHIERCQRDELIDYDFIRQLLEEIKVDNRSLH